MAALFKLQYLIIIIGVCLHLRSSYGFPLSCNGVQIITYGEPCYSSHQLPVTIEEPVEEYVTEPSKSLYRPLKLNYRAISTESPTCYQVQNEYPISIQVPQITEPLKIVTPDPYRGKSYKYDIQTPSIPCTPIPMSYNFDLQMPPPPPPSAISTPKPIKLLTDLTSKIDKVLIPACETSCIKTCVN
ncbi:uncharacterized protein [Linepithema humile]|uniref:uncharacterized protein n=1 Tax=Linepithema humile TaxID=83485 RepID=UPI00062313DD|nr:PREDICTED: uncharacterized protein LOC105668184 [Linepithema humile]